MEGPTGATYWLAGRPGRGGPRSAAALSPRSLRKGVRPDVRLETPPWIPAGRAPASGHRAVPKHEARLSVGLRRHDPRGLGDSDIVPKVEANGNKPISPLSVAAEPHCVSGKNCSWGGGHPNTTARRIFCSHTRSRGATPGQSARTTHVRPGSFASAETVNVRQVADCGRLRGASIHRAK